MDVNFPRREYLRNPDDPTFQLANAYARDILTTFCAENEYDYSHASWQYFDKTVDLYSLTVDEKTQYTLHAAGSYYQFGPSSQRVIEVSDVDYAIGQLTEGPAEAKYCDAKRVINLLRTNHGLVSMPEQGYVDYVVPVPTMNQEGEDALYALEHGESISKIIDFADTSESISLESILDCYNNYRWRDVPKVAARTAIRNIGLDVTPELLGATTFVLRRSIEAELTNRARD